MRKSLKGAVGVAGMVLLVGGTALAGSGVGAQLARTPPSAPSASSSTLPSPAADAPSVRGSWIITPQTPGPPFRALAAFAAGGSFLTTGSDQAGTGIGQWAADGADGFVFSYQNFHFGPDGQLATITSVDAKGTFQGDNLTGSASESVVDGSGASTGPARSATFTGTRMKATAP